MQKWKYIIIIIITTLNITAGVQQLDITIPTPYTAMFLPDIIISTPCTAMFLLGIIIPTPYTAVFLLDIPNPRLIW
jgi:hypothetical protein